MLSLCAVQYIHQGLEETSCGHHQAESSEMKQTQHKVTRLFNSFKGTLKKYNVPYLLLHVSKDCILRSEMLQLSRMTPPPPQDQLKMSQSQLALTKT